MFKIILISLALFCHLGLAVTINKGSCGLGRYCMDGWQCCDARFSRCCPPSTNCCAGIYINHCCGKQITESEITALNRRRIS
uniref:Cysteine rich secreted protein n=1 Tax=Riptortus pedestris TaxID=329032 RepID=R4WQI9_RIPPE|nr:cysteine rich secreted protein [Riptortus pedestris]